MCSLDKTCTYAIQRSSRGEIRVGHVLQLLEEGLLRKPLHKVMEVAIKTSVVWNSISDDSLPRWVNVMQLNIHFCLGLIRCCLQVSISLVKWKQKLRKMEG